MKSLFWSAAAATIFLSACTASAPKKSEAKEPDGNSPKPAKTLELNLTDLDVLEVSAKEAGKPVKLKFGNGMTGWAMQVPGGHTLATPAIKDGRLYIGGGFGSFDFYCLDAETGKQIWKVRTTDDGPTGAVVSGDYVAYNTESCTLEVRLCADGKLVWGRWLGDPLMSQPAISGDKVLMCWPTGNGGGFGIQQTMPQDNDNTDNDEDEEGNADEPPVATPANPDSGQTEQLAQNGGKAVASVPGTHGAVPKGKVMQGGIKVDGKGGHAIGCFDLHTGKLHWAKGIPSDCIQAPVVDRDRVYAATLDGTLSVIGLKSGKLISQEQRNATSAPWISRNNDSIEALMSERSSEKLKVDGKTIVRHYEGWSRNDDRGRKVGRTLQRQQADYLDRGVVRKNRYYSADAKLAQDTGVGFGSAPAAAQTAKAGDNLGESSIVGLWAFQGSRPVVYRGKTYNCLGNTVSGGEMDGSAVDWELTYRPDHKERLLSPPAAAGGQLVFAALDGTVFCLDAKSGELKHAVKMNKSFVFQPAVMDGKLYLATQDGWLIAIDTGDKSLSGWSMWGGGAAHNGK
ncbi:MAG: outer membrane protein assembly factor BamB family protein [Planctomycetota bacterium]|jgi:outer membrane protein assembly factor BamB